MLDYRKIARTIVKKHQDNIQKTIEKGQCPDLHWSLESAIEDALKYVAKRTRDNVEANVFELIKKFDEEKGPTNN